MSRFREMLRAQYGVSIPDNTVQVPEYLGGKRVPLNMQQVIQNSETTESSALGTTGAFSNTFDSSNVVHKSFSEHGYILVLCCIRTQNTYSQGINRMFLRNRRFDWYYPVFANLGEQVIKKIELYVPTSADANTTYTSGETVFGYQEAWAEYRYKPSMVAGYLHPDAQSEDNILSEWTYTNKFTAIPTLNSDFMTEGATKIANTLVVKSSYESYQFICDFYFDMTCRRVMPLYSIPGLVDHH